MCGGTLGDGIVKLSLPAACHGRGEVGAGRWAGLGATEGLR